MIEENKYVLFRIKSIFEIVKRMWATSKWEHYYCRFLSCYLVIGFKSYGMKPTHKISTVLLMVNGLITARKHGQCMQVL